MAKPSKKTTDQKLRVVLSVLRGEHSVAEAARRNGVPEQSVHIWKRQFLDAGREGLEKGARRRSSREFELEAENEELKAALGEAHVQLRVWRKGASQDLGDRPRRRPRRRVAVVGETGDGTAGSVAAAGLSDRTPPVGPRPPRGVCGATDSP